MRKIGIIALLVGLSCVSLSQGANETSSAASKNADAKSSAGWRVRMQGLYQTLSELLTDITSDRRFNDPKNKAKILNNAEKLASLSHELSSKVVTAPDSDPTLKIVNGLLAQETKDAVAALKSGNREYARTVLRTVPSYCVSCHTRNTSGAHFKELALEPIGPALTRFERGEFFAATRQFQRALAEFNGIIEDPKAPEADHWEWRRAIESSLMIAVRAERSPALAEKIVDNILKAKNAPQYLLLDAKAWKKSITEWKAEAPNPSKTEDSLRSEAMRLMAKAKETQQFMMDRSADILYLRSSAVIHDLLQVAQDPKVLADAFFMAGMSYEVLNPLKRENLHQNYYEACVRKLPHTEIAQFCYRRYEENVILGYTGSGGTSVPESVKERMNRLESLSAVMPASPAPRN